MAGVPRFRRRGPDAGLADPRRNPNLRPGGRVLVAGGQAGVQVVRTARGLRGRPGAEHRSAGRDGLLPPESVTPDGPPPLRTSSGGATGALVAVSIRVH